jgi:adenylate kinase
VFAEISQVVVDEARESYEESIVLELQSNAVDDVERNVASVIAFLQPR